MDRHDVKFFDNIAPSWDASEVRSTPSAVSDILKIIGVCSGSKVLDLGTGTGVLLPYLSNAVGEEGIILAVDASTGMLKEAKRKFGNLKNVRFQCADFEETCIDGKYDLIMMYCVYPHLNYPAKTLTRLVKENLVPGGRIVIAFPNDEQFVNAIHKEKKAPSDMLPSAPELARDLCQDGLRAGVMAYDKNRYIVRISA